MLFSLRLRVCIANPPNKRWTNIPKDWQWRSSSSWYSTGERPISQVLGGWMGDRPLPRSFYGFLPSDQTGNVGIRGGLRGSNCSQNRIWKPNISVHMLLFSIFPILGFFLEIQTVVFCFFFPTLEYVGWAKSKEVKQMINKALEGVNLKEGLSRRGGDGDDPVERLKQKGPTQGSWKKYEKPPERPMFFWWFFGWL